jgi:hypothetical protein
MTLTEAKFDIFSGHIDSNAMWLESVEGLSRARDRMRQIAVEKPGYYFVFSPVSNSVLSEIETLTESSESKAKGTAA